MGDIDISQKDPYFIAFKIFLEKGNSFLIMKDKFGDWDLPGGRMKKFEFESSFEDIIKRKMSEELGKNFLTLLNQCLEY
jgi:NUDIX domain